MLFWFEMQVSLAIFTLISFTSRLNLVLMKKVLIAEDSSVIQNLAKKILEFQNFEIHAVKNGQQVLDELAKADFDIILLDINMPVMDGWEFMEEMKDINSKINKKITIYIVSSSIAPEDKTKSKTFEIFDYISKPISVDDIKSIAEK